MEQIINEKTQEEMLTGVEDSPSEIVRIDFGNLKRDLGGFVRGTGYLKRKRKVFAEPNVMNVTKAVRAIAVVTTGATWRPWLGR